MQEAQIKSYKYKDVIQRLKDGSWETKYDVVARRHLEVIDNDTKKKMTIFVEDTQLSESFRPGHGMLPAPINDKTYKAKGLRKLWGIPMRAGKWADTFVGLFSDGRFAIINSDDIIYYSNIDDFEKGFEKYRKTNKLREGFYSIPNDEYFNDLTEAIESGSLIKAKILLSEYA